MEIKRASEHLRQLSLIFFSVDVRSLEELALSTLNKLISAYNEKPTLLILTFNPFQNTAGGYIPTYDAMEINLGVLRTNRDLIYTVSHEYRHLLQARRLGVKEMLKSSLTNAEVEETRKTADAIKQYLDSPLERDADEFAFKFEQGLTYKSVCINPTIKTSAFVDRKEARHMLSPV